jgi:hypothetical protein
MRTLQKDVKEYKYITIWVEEDKDILISTYLPGLEVDLAIAQDLVRCRLDYSNGAPRYTLIDFTNIKGANKEVRDYMNSPEGGLKGILGGAFLSNNVVSNVFINLYLKINRPVVPAKFFTKKEDAINWLKNLKKSQEGPVNKTNSEANEHE